MNENELEHKIITEITDVLKKEEKIGLTIAELEKRIKDATRIKISSACNRLEGKNKLFRSDHGNAKVYTLRTLLEFMKKKNL